MLVLGLALGVLPSVDAASGSARAATCDKIAVAAIDERRLPHTLPQEMRPSLDLSADKELVPGVSIGGIRLDSSLSKVFRALGIGSVVGSAATWPNATVYAWDAHGLWIIADNETGNLLYISIDTSGTNGWAAGVALSGGLRLGSSMSDALKTLGLPEFIVSGGGGTSIYYDTIGLRLTFPDAGAAKNTVACMRIVWPVKSRGDTAIVAGKRISVVAVGATLQETLLALGGGYTRMSWPNGRLYGWSHLGLGLIEVDGKVISARAMRAHNEDKFDIRYTLEAGGVGVGSSRDSVRKVYGEPSRILGFGELTMETYDAAGIGFAFDESGNAVLVEVFEPRAPPKQ